MGVGDDLLPDTNPYRERTLSGNVALALGFVMIVFVTTGFVTPNWLEVDPRFYGTQFQKLGLWVHCFNSYPDINDHENQRFFVACRWIFNPFTKGYAEIRYLIVPRKLYFYYTEKILETNYKILFFSLFCGHSVFLHSLLHRDVDIDSTDAHVPAVY